jgi:hypothetical protein
LRDEHGGKLAVALEQAEKAVAAELVPAAAIFK